MENIIQSISETSVEIIHQLIHQEMVVKKTAISKKLQLKENISVISGFVSSKRSFQIAVNFSEELVKKIYSHFYNGLPLVLIDDESKHIIMEISKLIISNSIICLDDYDEFSSLSPPCIIEGSDMTYSSNGLVSFMEFNLMGEELTIAVLPIAEMKDVYEIKDVYEKNFINLT